jgi:predicted PurR-regulated permease PerM
MKDLLMILLLIVGIVVVIVVLTPVVGFIWDYIAPVAIAVFCIYHLIKMLRS